MPKWEIIAHTTTRHTMIVEAETPGEARELALEHDHTSDAWEEDKEFFAWDIYNSGLLEEDKGS